MIEYVINGSITALSMAIGSYIMFRVIKKQVKTELEDWINSEKGQKALYSIGGMLGSGIMSGTGLKQGSGKMKFQDILIQLGLGWAKSKGLILGLGETPSEASESSKSLGL